MQQEKVEKEKRGWADTRYRVGEWRGVEYRNNYKDSIEAPETIGPTSPRDIVEE
jgi:hypothetical protein